MDKIIFKWNDDIKMEDCFYIREQVFCCEQNISKEDEIDGIDDECEQVVGFVNDNPVATGRIVLKDDGHHLGRISVLKEFRGNGFATLLVEEMISHLKNQGIEEIYLSSQLYVKKLYEKIGFKPFGEIYLDCEIEHIDMKYGG